ncbi:glucosamine-6-phosphate deaminase [Paenibacillus sp. J31TS4]|uniref:6-phosphogluconolactonase n=1 Tax=Paenibacillus sp. J31TS4 TaxID=2807195 RepID=UPI001B0874DA|nr:glucosamine-6-phosphate deaminase [Paenibacillus sp. J31TS4]GIP37123.1 glucosamine-6-phosphate deaminase [Paenibacillus sp. J31TS4]
MHLTIHDNAEKLGEAAAAKAAEVLDARIREQGKARLVLSTGASQFSFLRALAQERVDWSRVEMFHLDEYVGLPESHPASFRKYLKERFLSFAPVAKAHLVDGEGELDSVLASLSAAIREAPIDLALIGIGENAHIAFNDPPADFDAEEPYKVVELDDACKAQQVREGWFPSAGEVPRQAITMTVPQIMACRTILSCVPYRVKAEAIRRTLEEEVTPLVPASILKRHGDWWLYLDRESASALPDAGKEQQERT